ncbi:ATP-binding protein [Azospirillum sp. HJ39]|uniref:ATP-binding protein n=1 Tax=Azospirillum sp. HJ39 TaxID=3159496 RepID=UPI003557417D
MSLKMRILALIGLFLLLMAAAGGAVLVANARDAVQAEMASALELGSAIGRRMVGRDAAAADLETLNGLGLRHLRFIPDDAAPEPVTELQHAPDWFAALIAVEPQELRLADGGGLRIVAEPWDEIAEVWEDMSDLAAAMLAVGFLLLTAAYLAVGRALAPLARFEAGLERLRAGRYNLSLDAGGVPELDRLGSGIAALAEGLAAAERENRRVGQRIVAAQDAERREIARDVHDELGAALFAIKVDAGRILRLTGRAPDAASREGASPDMAETAGEVAGRARTILDTAAEVHRLSRRILVRLRPALPDQLPLSEALTELVGDWARRKPEVEWTLSMEPQDTAQDAGADTDGCDLDGCDEVLRLTVYRLVQESLVNALRHATPTAVAVRVAALGDRVEIAVTDDGPGLPGGHDPARSGFGISGMMERVQALGGCLTIGDAGGSSSNGGGTRVSARLPRHTPSPAPSPATAPAAATLERTA